MFLLLLINVGNNNPFKLGENFECSESTNIGLKFLAIMCSLNIMLPLQLQF